MSFAPGGTPDDFYGPDWRDRAADEGWWNPDDMSQAMTDVFNERFRQWDDEGFSRDHDDEHTDGELAKAASAYAWIAGTTDAMRESFAPGDPVPTWPWENTWWKPKDRRSDLVRAGALILAEIERIDRTEKS